MERTLFVLQRVTAAVLAVLVMVHIVGILQASAGALSAAEILARTRGSTLFAGFYGLFVAAAAAHAPIGLRNVLHEWTSLSRRTVDMTMLLFSIVLLWLGASAVFAVYAG